MLLAAHQAYARQYVRMENPQLGLEFEYEYEKEERRGPFISSEESVMNYTERLDIHTRGWIYHPGLAVYKLTYSPEWKQLRSKPGSGVVESKSFLHGYTADMTILQYKPYSLKLFGFKKITTINSNFAKRSKNESTGYGGTLSLRNELVPTSLSYVHSESEQTGLFETSFDRDEFHLNGTFVKLGATRLRASYIDSTQITQNNLLDSEQQTVSLSNSLSPRGLSNISLASSLSFADIENTNQDSRRENIYERLSWKHSDTLSTYYSLHYETEDRFDKTGATNSDRQVTSGDISLSHALYENLNTNLLAAVARSKFEDDEEVQYELSGKFNYKRRIPWGMLNVNISQSIEMVDENIIPDIGQIIDEPLPLKNGWISFLDKENVDLSSIIITDSTGLTTYFPGMDYKITEVGSLTRITCVSGGNIDQPGDLCNTGTSVLVSYRYIQQPSFDYYTYRQAYGVNIDLMKALLLYYRISFLNQYYRSGIRPDILTDEIRRLGGVELALRWSKTTLEFENNNSRSNPIEAFRMRETITLRQYNNLYMNFTVNYATTSFENTGARETFNGIRANVQVLTSQRSQLTLAGFWDRTSGDDKLIEDSGFSALYTKVWRIYKFDVNYSFSVEKNRIADEDVKNHFLLFKISREIF